MLYIFYKASLRCWCLRSFEDCLSAPDCSVLHCADIALLNTRCRCACTNLLDFLLDLAVHCVLNGARLALSNFVDILEREDVTDARGTRLEKHCCWTFEAKEQLRKVSSSNVMSHTKTYPVAPDCPSRPCLNGVPCG
jgi:hypothetical protein